MEAVIDLNLDNWTFQEYMEFMASARSVFIDDAWSANVRMHGLIDIVLKSWSFDSRIEDGIRGLPGSAEMTQVVLTILARTTEYMRIADTSEVVVDKTKLTPSRKRDLQEAKNKRQQWKVEKIVHQIATLPGASQDTPLTFTQGVKMIKAIQML